MPALGTDPLAHSVDKIGIGPSANSRLLVRRDIGRVECSKICLEPLAPDENRLVVGLAMAMGATAHMEDQFAARDLFNKCFGKGRFELGIR